MQGHRSQREITGSVDHAEVRQIIQETVATTLTQLGIDHENPIEMQKDFQYLHDLRRTSESLKSKGLLALVGVLVSGLLAATWLGIKEALK